MTDNATMTSVERALAVLGAFQLDDTSLSLAELAQRTKFYKSTILRLARSLQNAHFLVRLESGRYQLGAEVVRLGEICKRGSTLDRLIIPVLQKLVEETGESATLYVRKGEHQAMGTKSRLTKYSLLVVPALTVRAKLLTGGVSGRPTLLRAVVRPKRATKSAAFAVFWG